MHDNAPGSRGGAVQQSSQTVAAGAGAALLEALPSALLYDSVTIKRCSKL